MRVQRWLVLSILCLGLPSISWAVTRYVSVGGHGETSVTDSNSCAASTSTSTPKRNIMGAQGGLACMSAGDRLELRGGSYQERISNSLQTIPVGTSETTRITIASYPGETATLNPTGGGGVDFTDYVQYITFDRLVFDGANFDAVPCEAGQNNQGQLIVLNHAHHIRFQNGEMKNGAGPHVQLYAASTDPIAYQGFNEVINSKIHDARCSYGFYVNQQNTLIDGNEIYNNAGYAIQMYGGIYGTEANNDSIIRNNKMYGNGYDRGYGALVIANGRRMQVYNNIFSNNYQGVSTEAQQPSDQMAFYNNTVTGNGGEGLYIGTGATNLQVRNNIFYQNSGGAISNNGPSSTFGTNQCGSSGTGCTPALVGNPGFASSAGGDFHIATAGSPANNCCPRLGTVLVDAENVTRSDPTTAGAYQFGTPVFTPLGTIAKYTFEEGSGLTAADSSGQGANCALTSAAWGAGIIGTFSFAPTGAQSCTAPMATGIRPTTQAGLSGWINDTTTPAEGSFLATFPGDALALYVYPPPDGRPLCQVYDGTTFYEATGSASVLTGTSRHLSCSFKSGDGIRLRVDDAQVAFFPLTTTMSNGAGFDFAVGRSSLNNAYRAIGRVDQVYGFDTEITAAMNTLLFNELVPPTGMSVAHMAWYAANTAPGAQQLGTTDAPRSHLITAPLGIRYALRKSDPGALTEYFRIFCITNTGAGFPPWTSALELSNSFGSLGIRYLADTAITQGQSIAALLPLDGFTAVNGKVLENPIDTTSPYDASQRMTIAQGQHAEEEIRVEFGSPLVAGHQIQCRPHRENSADFGTSNYANIQTLTLTAVQPPSAVKIWGVTSGGTMQ